MQVISGQRMYPLLSNPEVPHLVSQEANGRGVEKGKN